VTHALCPGRRYVGRGNGSCHLAALPFMAEHRVLCAAGVWHVEAYVHNSRLARLLLLWAFKMGWWPSKIGKEAQLHRC